MKPYSLSNYSSRKDYPHFRTLKNIYVMMINRVKSDVGYLWRGIKVCDEWLGKKGFENFYDWAIANGYKYEPTFINGHFQNSLTLDRLDGLGDYEPKNCRWTTWEIQNHNRNGGHITKKEKEYFYHYFHLGIIKTYKDYEREVLGNK